MLWPFGKPSAQAGGGLSATDVAVEAMQREAAGRGPVDSSALALSQACIGLWERAIASASIAPIDSMALARVSPAVLALTGRMLATRGNAVFAIDANPGSGILLHPASSWDPRGGYRADSRRYYLTLAGPQATVTRNLHGDSVLHFQTGATDAEWWCGRAPLYRARATAGLAAEIERQMTAEAKLPVGRLIGLGGSTPEQSLETTKAIRQGGVHVAGFAQGFADQAGPSNRLSPQAYGAAPAVGFEALRSHVAQEICAAFGVPPALVSAGADGRAQRESWRRFWLGTIAPLGRMIEAELRAKLDPSATVTFEALAAADEDGRSRAISRRAAAAKTLADMGLERGEALRLAGLEGQEK